MNYAITYLVFILIGSNVFAKPTDVLKPEDVCKSIDSNKYQAQCEQALYKAEYFQPSALAVCSKIKSDYEKKSCIEVIRNQSFKADAIEKCLENEKLKKGVPLNKCLQNNGRVFIPKSKSKNDNDGIE